jgi:Cu/Ag efflux pump CusA
VKVWATPAVVPCTVGLRDKDFVGGVKLLTEGVAFVAIAPMLFATGGEIISAMALSVLGGLLIAGEVVDILLPVRFYRVRRARWLKLL